MDEKINLVVEKLTHLRSQLDPEEQQILDLIVGAKEEDEVEGHQLTPQALPIITLRIDQQAYMIVTK